MSMFQVQKGIPLPDISRSPKGVRRKYPIEGMEVGDMFFVPERTSKSVSAYISRISKGLPSKFSVRGCWMRRGVQKRDGQTPEWVEAAEGEPNALEGAGVWRIE